MTKGRVIPLAAATAALVLLVSACSSADSGSPESSTPVESPSTASSASPTPSESATSTPTVEPSHGEAPPSAAYSDYLGDYELVDSERGTITTVTVADDVRTIVTNALPNHETGEFPNPGNPNTISAQDNTWEFPVDAVYTGEARDVKVTGVGLNGVKFDPNTAERVTCATGETYNLEALQDVSDLGMDFNNAHVQPNGEYHYHGVSELLVDLYDREEDLVLVGFAADGNLMYYSTSGAYTPGYQISAGERAGTDCTYTAPLRGTTQTFGSTKDGSLRQDWEYSPTVGNLDECNGTTVDGEYIYLITDTYPFVPRCLMGEFEETEMGPPPGGMAPPDGMGPPPQ